MWKTDHAFSKCPSNLAKKEWWVNKMIQGMQDDGNNEEDSDNESVDNSCTKKGKGHSKGKGKEVHWSRH